MASFGFISFLVPTWCTACRVSTAKRISQQHAAGHVNAAAIHSAGCWGCHQRATRPSAAPPLPVPGASGAPLSSGSNNPAPGVTPAIEENGSTTLFGLDGSGKAVIPSVTQRVPYSLSLNVSAVYDDNTSLSRNGSRGDFYFAVSPVLTLGLDNLANANGNYLHFFYSPVASFYVDSSRNDSLQHLIGLAAQSRFGQFEVGARVSVQILDGTDTASLNPGPGVLPQPGQTAGSQPIYSTGTISQTNLDVSGRSELNLYDASVNVSYLYSDKTSFSGGLQASISDYSSLLSSENLAASLYVNYVYSTKTFLSVGVTGGHTFAESPNPDQDFVQTNVRTSYRYSNKLSLTGSVGAEFVLSDSRGGVEVTPVFELSISYQPDVNTSVSLAGSRGVQSSAVTIAQNFESTAITAGVRRVINNRLTAGITLGYGNAHYVSVADRVNASRDDDYFTVQSTVSISLRPKLGLTLFYEHRENFSSGQSSRSFSNNQAGISLGYTF